MFSSSIPAASSIRRSRNRSTRSSKMAGVQARRGRAKRLVVAEKRALGGTLSRRYPKGHAGRRRSMGAFNAEIERIVAVCEGIEEPSPVENKPLFGIIHDLDAARARYASRLSPMASRSRKRCDHPGTFCVIPQYRGNFRSRRFESGVSEATLCCFRRACAKSISSARFTTCYGEAISAWGDAALLCCSGAARAD